MHAPTLERLASGGVFLNHYAQPFCVPDRASTWSGLWAHNNGFGSGSTPGFEFDLVPGFQDLRPLAAAMETVGYRTGFGG